MLSRLNELGMWECGNDVDGILHNDGCISNKNIYYIFVSENCFVILFFSTYKM